MRFLAVGGLGLYGAANTFAGIYGLLAVGGLPLCRSLLPLVTGALLLVASVGVVRNFRHARSLAAIAIVLGALLALYNERILGLGHPTHHLVRGAYSLVLIWAVWKSTATERAQQS